MCSVQIIVTNQSSPQLLKNHLLLELNTKERLIKYQSIMNYDDWLQSIKWVYVDEEDDELKGRISELVNGVPTVLYTDDLKQYWFSLLSLGVGAFVSTRDPRELPRAIQTVLIGGIYFSQYYKSKICEALFWESLTGDDEEILALTPMEKKVIKEIAKDRSNKEIAQTLHISERTVEHYVSTSLRKMGVKSRVGLVVKAFRLHDIN